ncbi:MAG TPA: S53 family peptidase [Trebonia sp.]|nr:S53 family peptidase [Trebonia sp.]
MRKVRTVALTAGAGAITVAFVTAMATGATAAPAGITHDASGVPTIAVKPGVHMLDAKSSGSPLTYQQCEAELSIACYSPDQVRSAYNLAPVYKSGVTGKGSTILIVDSYGSPTIASDLHTFDQTFGYPDPPSLKVIQSDGPVPAWDPGNATQVNWGGETTLDVEYAHTVAPGANIVLDETPVAETEGITGFPQIVQAELNVINHPRAYGVTGKIDVISQSFGATEETFTSFRQLESVRTAYVDAARHGITVLASTGDTGATSYEDDGVSFFTRPVTNWPATDPLVTAVGGTQIQVNAKGLNGFSQVVWNDTFNPNLLAAFTGSTTPAPFATTGGVSQFFRLPSYQDGVARTIAKDSGTLSRAVPDISMSGACNGAVDLYLTFPGVTPGWTLVCGTSEASPEFSGIVALADQVAHHSLGQINPRLYQLSADRAPGLVDVTAGNNTVAFTQGTPPVTTTVNGYSAGRGYDLASGVGTLNAQYFVPELAGNGHIRW